MPSRSEVIVRAIWEANDGTWHPTAAEMQDFFRTAHLNPPTTAMAQGSLNGGNSVYTKLDYGVWSPAGGFDAHKNPKAMVIHWCGIFACYVLKKWGGYDVHWVSGTGIRGPGVSLKTANNNVDGIEPGDVAWIRGPANSKGQYTYHHFIVTNIDRSTNELESVDGNSTGNSINWYSNSSPASSPGPKKIIYPSSEVADKQIRGFYKLVG